MTNEEQPAPEPSEVPVLPAERRRAERYPCALQPFWRVVGEEQADSPSASVRDVPATGGSRGRCRRGSCTRRPRRTATGWSAVSSCASWATKTCRRCSARNERAAPSLPLQIEAHDLL